VRGMKIALASILCGDSVLQALLRGRRLSPQSKWSKDKMIEQVSLNAQALKAIGKTEIRLHIYTNNHWTTRKCTPDNAEWMARRQFEDGATKVKVY
jgi:hypothetical protein